MRLRPAHLIAVMFGCSVLGLGLIVFVLFGANLAPVVTSLPLSRTQQETLLSLMPKEPFVWPWQRGGMLAPVTVLPPDADRNRIEPLPHITPATAGSKTVLMEGTGFFISADGTLLTAAHLVKDCTTIRITSRYAPSAVATKVAVDLWTDLAMIRAPVFPPGVLGLTSPPTGYAKLLIYGYPPDRDAFLASEVRGTTWRDLDSGQGENPSQLLRIDSEGVRNGFSGGPILTREGDVIGMVKGAIVVRDQAKPEVITPTGIAVGPGSGAIASFVGKTAPMLRMVDIAARHAAGDDPREIARKAVVRVSCGR